MRIHAALLVASLAFAQAAQAAQVATPSGVTASAINIDRSAMLSWNADPLVTQWQISLDGVTTYQPFVGDTTLNGSVRQFRLQFLPGNPSISLTMRALSPPNTASFYSAPIILAPSPASAQPVNIVSSIPLTITGSVSVAFPASQAVTQGGPFTVSGSVAVTELPSSYQGVSVITGVAGLTVTASQGSPWTVSGSVDVTGALPAGSNILGSVGISHTVAVSLSQPANAIGTIGGNGQAVTVTAYGGNGGFIFQFTAGFTGTIVCDISVDGGTTWSQVPFFYGNAAVFTQVISQANPATNSVIIPQNNGAPLCRLRASAYTSGTATIKGIPVSASLSPWLATQPSSQSGTWTVQPGNTANTTPWLVAASMIAGQAYSVSSPAFTSGSTYAGVVKTSTGVLGGVIVTSLTTTAGIPTVVHYYNQTFTPTVGATANRIARCAQVGPGSFNCDHAPQGLNFSTGIAYTLTGGLPDTDTTVIPADAAVLFEYR